MPKNNDVSDVGEISDAIRNFKRKEIPDNRTTIQEMIDRWLLDAERLRKLALVINTVSTKHKLTQTADRLSSAAALLNYTKDEV